MLGKSLMIHQVFYICRVPCLPAEIVQVLLKNAAHTFSLFPSGAGLVIDVDCPGNGFRNGTPEWYF